MPFASAQMQIDLSRPFGPFLDESQECTLTRNSISFRGGKTHDSVGYTMFAQFTPLQPTYTKHILSLQIEGLVQEYGMNAVAIVLDDESKPLDATLKWSHLFVAKSQNCMPFDISWMTMVLDTEAKTVTLYAEGTPTEVGGKRPRLTWDQTHSTYRNAAAPQWDQTRCDKWKEVDDQLYTMKYNADYLLAERMPLVGVRMDGMLGNKVSVIRPTRTAAFQHIELSLDMRSSTVVYE